MLSQLNRELALLEPILASGKLSKQTATFRVGGPARKQSGNRGANLLQPPSSRQAEEQAVSKHDVLEAAVIEQGSAMLVLPVWYQHEAQYVPGEMYAREATLVVPPASASAAAWLLTTHGLQNLKREQEAGGTKIWIDNFDQTAIVILTSDFELIRELKKAALGMGKASAADGVALARAKFERVRGVEAELEELGVTRAESERLLVHADKQISYAEQQFRNGYYAAAAGLATDAMRTLRALQRIRWNDARRDLAQPGTSPYLYSYQTLPLHWRFLKLLEGRNKDQAALLLESGSFESVEALVDDRWEHVQFRTDDARAAAALDRSGPPGVSGEYSLRLAAGPVGPVNLAAPPSLFERPLVRYSTPKIRVEPGDVLYIRGWMRIRFPGEGRLDRGLISDNLTGEAGSLRFAASRDWQPFELLRVADESGIYQLSFALECALVPTLPGRFHPPGPRRTAPPGCPRANRPPGR